MRKGFTLIELMIVIAIIAIIAAIAIPNLMESRVTANESAASASLKSGVLPSQTTFTGSSYLDRDQDNVGEYGTLRMLAGLEPTTRLPFGTTGANSGLRLLTGPLSNSAVWTAGASSTACAYGAASGFFFAGAAPSETNTDAVSVEVLTDGLLGAATAVPDLAATDSSANNGERGWAAAAVPAEWGNTGRRVFFIGGDGQMRSPASAEVTNQVFSGGTAAIANGQRPGNGTAPAPGEALLRAIFTGVGGAAVTSATAVASPSANGLDGATYNGYPIFSK